MYKCLMSIEERQAAFSEFRSLSKAANAAWAAAKAARNTDAAAALGAAWEAAHAAVEACAHSVAGRAAAAIALERSVAEFGEGARAYLSQPSAWPTLHPVTGQPYKAEEVPQKSSTELLVAAWEGFKSVHANV